MMSTPRSTATAAGSPAASASRYCAAPSSTSPPSACLARFDIEHAIRTLKGTLGLTAAKVRAPEQADRRTRVVIAAQAQLLLARPLATDLRRPWEKQPDPTRPLSPGRVLRGFRNIRPQIGTPARVPKPARPCPGRPKGSSTGPATRHLLPGEADMPRTTNTAPPGKRLKVKLSR